MDKRVPTDERQFSCSPPLADPTHDKAYQCGQQTKVSLDTTFNVLQTLGRNTQYNTQSFPNTPSTNGYNGPPNDGRGFLELLDTALGHAMHICLRNSHVQGNKSLAQLCFKVKRALISPNRTLHNIETQGIPFVVKDFIYSLVRLTNCWHTLVGYRELHQSTQLIELNNILNAEFHQAFERWESVSIEFSAILTRVFTNLDRASNGCQFRSIVPENQSFQPIPRSMPPTLHMAPELAERLHTSSQQTKTTPPYSSSWDSMDWTDNDYCDLGVVTYAPHRPMPLVLCGDVFQYVPKDNDVVYNPKREMVSGERRNHIKLICRTKNVLKNWHFITEQYCVKAGPNLYCAGSDMPDIPFDDEFNLAL